MQITPIQQAAKNFEAALSEHKKAFVSLFLNSIITGGDKPNVRSFQSGMQITKTEYEQLTPVAISQLYEHNAENAYFNMLNSPMSYAMAVTKISCEKSEPSEGIIQLTFSIGY